ncbi:MAG TPA: hypothetical protein VM223_03840 [Planctomycetota bacterium]|nr:hypothetical protein [Planctomycetota bacterium]
MATAQMTALIAPISQTSSPTVNLVLATNCYIRRHARLEHPRGRADNGGRWHPVDDERGTCCDAIRGPSRAYPWSLMLHCRTLRHIAHLYGVDLAELRRAVHAAQRQS